MKVLVVFVGLAVAVLGYEPIFTDYHEQFGIPTARRIKLAEEALDFDGSRITGGSNAGVGAHPHLGGLIVTLTDGRQSVCGSSLVTNNRLVTAAHCWRHGSSQGRSLTVVFGSTLLFSGGTRVNSNNVQMHASYTEWNLANDVAIIVIGWVNFSNNINRIALATGSNNFAGTWATAAGFGRTGDNVNIGQGQNKRHVNMQIITNAVCAQTYGANTILASTLCTATTGGQSVCQGDSGGPLAVGSGNNRILVGITSFVHRNGCQRGFPAGFARVSSFVSWINARL